MMIGERENRAIGLSILAGPGIMFWDTVNTEDLKAPSPTPFSPTIKRKQMPENDIHVFIAITDLIH